MKKFIALFAIAAFIGTTASASDFYQCDLVEKEAFKETKISADVSVSKFTVDYGLYR